VTTTIMIDPNVRVRGNGTYAGLEDVRGNIAVGVEVEVFEPESDLVGQGRVTEIDVERRLVYLSVDWSSLRTRAMVAVAPAWDPQQGIDALGATWSVLLGVAIVSAAKRPVQPHLWGETPHLAGGGYYLHPLPRVQMPPVPPGRLKLRQEA
jgi:hypothetical protein